MALNIYVSTSRLELLWKLAGQVWSISDNWIFSPTCDIYINSCKAHQETSGKGTWTEYKSRRMVMSTVKTLSFSKDVAALLMNAQQLWLPIQDLHRIRPVNIPAWAGEDTFLVEELCAAAGCWWGGWFFFWAMAVGRLPVLWWMVPRPCTCSKY